MDEPLKRRLVGAGVLLGGAFLLASLLPDRTPPERASRGGFPGDDLRLPPPAAAEAEAEDAAAAAPVEAPAPPRPALKVDENLGGPARGWHVQIGSFENQDNARKVLQKLYGAGLPAAIQSVPVDRKLWYRVRVGPLPDEASARAALAAVRAQGYGAAQIVRPDAPPERGGN